MEETEKRHRPSYSAEHKAASVAMARSGHTLRDVARVMGSCERNIRRWVQQTDIDQGKRAGLTTVQQRELTLLRRANARLDVYKRQGSSF